MTGAPLTFRPAAAEEMGQLGSLGGYVYGGVFGDGPDSMTATSIRPEWTLCAFDGDRLAASFATIPFTMRLDGAAIALGGVSAVGTRPEYRRRGILRRLMTQSTAEMRDQGRPVAALWASQAAIYQRYGYTIGSMLRSYAVDTVDVAFADGDPGSAEVSIVDADDALDALRPLYVEFVAPRTGYLHRSGALWRAGPLADVAADGPVHTAVATDGAGNVRGAVVYTLRGNPVDHRARGQELVVRDLLWLDVDAYRSLWSFLARHDLVGRIKWAAAPLDDPAEALFAEPRMLHRSDDEGIWFRIVDAEAAFAGRGYSTPGQVSVTITDDPIAPWNVGSYSVESDGTEVEVNRLRTSPPAGTISGRVGAVSSLFCGMTPARSLRSWGLLDGDGAAIAAADALFATGYAPHCPDHF